MMNRFLILLMLLFVTPSIGAAAEFQQVIGGPKLDRGVFVTPTSDGGYAVVGVTQNTEAGGEDIYFVKTDGAGTPVWTKTYGGSGDDNGWCVAETENGYVIAGYTDSFGAGGFDVYLLAVDDAGELRWSKTYGGKTDDRCWDLLSLDEGGYMLVGETVDPETEAEDFLLIRIDEAGEELWSRSYGGDKGDRAFSIEPADDGGFLGLGQTYSEGAGDRDADLIKTDAAGEMEWSRTYGGPAKDVGHHLGRTADGHYLITGYTVSFAASGSDPYLLKVDANGDTLWTRTPAIGGEVRTLTGAQGTGGGFFLTGFRHEPSQRRTAALLIHTDSEGHVTWTREILSTQSGQSFGYTVRATADGGCVFTGHTTVGSAGDLDLLLVKVAAMRDK